MSLLEIRELRKTYRAPDGSVQTVLDIPAFELDEGQQVGLAGRSGSGKTTLLNIIAGILTPDSGQVTLDGSSLDRLPESARDRLRARTVGYVFQTFNLLLGYTALENVVLGMTFGRGPNRGLARDLLVRLGLEDRLNYRPSQLSVGQQQRVAVARALAGTPKLVLADEPTGNLDPGHSAEALDTMRKMCAEQHAALLLVSHDQSVLDQFDTVYDLAEINRASTPAPEPTAGKA